MKRSRSSVLSTQVQSHLVPQSDRDFTVFSRLKQAYKEKFARYLFGIWSNVPPSMPRSPVFEVAGKRTVLTLSSKEDAVLAVNMSSPTPKFLHLAILNDHNDFVHFSVNRGVRYAIPPSNQSVWKAVSALCAQIPLEFYPAQLQPQPPTSSGVGKKKKLFLRF